MVYSCGVSCVIIMVKDLIGGYPIVILNILLHLVCAFFLYICRSCHISREVTGSIHTYSRMLTNTRELVRAYTRVHAPMCTQTCVHTYVHIHTYIHTYMQAYTCAHMCTCTHMCIHVHTRTRTRTRTRTHTHTRTIWHIKQKESLKTTITLAMVDHTQRSTSVHQYIESSA